ncbi:uncharacterized protein LOC122817606 isoform X2 [Protopterus annectens]|uniref:uncharacterized protein LOC122817606 isoform X2 n=1 Tax=Protopterus annectens TaxID=7888 RepID=UPI001CF9A327|nr:uncharacterized protein LOC122817606 isoform X2 [Protopterus annectens]
MERLLMGDRFVLTLQASLLVDVAAAVVEEVAEVATEVAATEEAAMAAEVVMEVAMAAAVVMEVVTMAVEAAMEAAAIVVEAMVAALVIIAETEVRVDTEDPTETTTIKWSQIEGLLHVNKHFGSRSFQWPLTFGVDEESPNRSLHWMLPVLISVSKSVHKLRFSVKNFGIWVNTAYHTVRIKCFWLSFKKLPFTCPQLLF